MKELDGEVLNLDLDESEPVLPAEPAPPAEAAPDFPPVGPAKVGGAEPLPQIQDDLEPAEAEGIRGRLENIINADPRKLHRIDGTVKPVHEWPEREASAIMRHTYNERTKLHTFQFFDKVRAAENLAKIDGMFAKDNVQKHPMAELFDSIDRDDLQVIKQYLRGNDSG